MPINGYKVIWPDGEESDPFDSDALMESCRRGYVPPETMIYDPTVQQWLPASQVSVVAALFAPPGTIQEDPVPVPELQRAGHTVATLDGPVAAPDRPSPEPYAGSVLSEWKPAPPWLAQLPRILLIPIAVATGLLIGLGGFAIRELGHNTTNLTMAPKRTVASFDGLYCFSVPATWARWNGPDKRLIEYTSGRSGVAITKVWRQPSNEAEVDHVTAAVEKDAVKSLHSSGRIGDITTVEVGGFPSQRFEMNDGGHAAIHRYQYTLVDTPRGVYAVIVFTPVDAMTREREVLNDILDSFRAINTPATQLMNQ